ncbi:MAG: HupE/UreJ family protein [Deltaproteobacteria bacterium]|nr:HupE/UreJ family protein [Deltaproteobacteria bacterium]MBW2666005.1 HupE/UreJ family protein [Deltaproteobacteria bacterium]
MGASRAELPRRPATRSSGRAPCRIGLIVGALCLFVAASASAHGRSVSYSTWAFDQTGAEVRARISRLELTRLALDPTTSQQQSDEVGRLLVLTLQLRSGDRPCGAPGDPVALPAETGWVVFGWRLECPQRGDRTITSRLLLDVAPSHLHFARVVGEHGVERVLSEAEPSWLIKDEPISAAPNVVGSSFGSYLGLGVEHILSGWDHLAFVLALLLLAATVREVAALVTGFTVAHSVTLGLAVLGVVHPDGRVVEALIGFSITLVAVENSWILSGRGRIIPWIAIGSLVVFAIAGFGVVPRGVFVGLGLFTACHFALLGAAERPARLRTAVAFAFGLIHGFGFAGVLAEMALPSDRLVPALLGFNLGVELGQLAVVAVAWPVLRLVARSFGSGVESLVVEVGSAAVCGLGLFWFVTRSLS